MKISAALLLLILFSLQAFAQEDDITLPPYKRFPTHPPMQLLLADSATKYTKSNLPANKPVLVMLFSPDCDHCQHETEEMVKMKDDFKNIQVVMITTYPLYRMKQFVEEYRVNEIPNVVVGRDPYYLMPPFYDAKSFPILAMYNKKGELIKVVEGSLPIPKVLQLFKENE